MPVTLLVTGYYRHPKMMTANAVSTGELAEVLWCRGLDYVNEHLTDGFIPAGLPAMLCPTKTAQRVRGLVKAGLWDEVEGGWRVHDYGEWNRPAAELAERARVRSEAKSRAGKAGAAKRWGSRLPKAEASHNDGKEDGEGIANEWHSDSPGPGPGPGPGCDAVPETPDVELREGPDHVEEPADSTEEAAVARQLRAVLKDWPEVDPDELRRLA